MDWDWSKFDAPPGSSRSENSTGGEKTPTTRPADAGANEAKEGTINNAVPASTTAEGVASRTQVNNVAEYLATPPP